MICLVYANINTPFPFESIPAALVPAKLRQSIKGNTRVQRRHRCRRLAHFLLWQLLKISQKETALLANVDRTNSGRPYFPDNSLDFNISHSGDWVAVILHANADHDTVVGVDIEVSKRRNFSALMAHFAPTTEIAWFDQQANDESAFYRCWTIREAILKSQGVGIVKLSEVDHFPEKREIYSAHCPQGQLIFSAELPFYLSAFCNDREQTWQCFEWKNGKLMPKPLKNIVTYQVNKKDANL